MYNKGVTVQSVPETVQWVSIKLAMVTACTKIYCEKAGFHSSTRALAVTNLCFWIPTEQFL